MKLKQAASLLIAATIYFGNPAAAQLPPKPTEAIPAKIIIDTDIGDDIDDAFALGLALASPEVKIVGISSAWGNTALRTRMIDRLLCETGREDIPSLTGIEKTKPGAGAFSQEPWAQAGPASPTRTQSPSSSTRPPAIRGRSRFSPLRRSPTPGQPSIAIPPPSAG